MRQPNIILINCDDIGYGSLGCYGSKIHDTPHLDRMAAQGMRFTDFYASAAVCTPSRAGMMTGCYPPRIGMTTFSRGNRWVLFPGEKKGLPPDEKTIATLLKEAGYETALIGKWHLGDQPEFLPTRHGFDEYFGLLHSNDMKPPKFNEPLRLYEGERVVEESPSQSDLTRIYTEKAVDYIHRKQGRPFFLYLAHLYPHLPLDPDPRFVAASRNGLYGAEIACIDWSTGQLLNALQSLGLDGKTLVLFTSDHGAVQRFAYTNHPLRGAKGSMWEGGLRVPLLARWTGTVPAGQTCDQLVTNMDLLPTLCNLAAALVPADREIDGKDISNLLQGQVGARSPHKAFFYYLRDELHAVRSGNWKLHLTTGHLYDLSRDVGESNNVAANHADIVAKLGAMAQTCRASLGDALTGVRGSHIRTYCR